MYRRSVRATKTATPENRPSLDATEVNLRPTAAKRRPGISEARRRGRAIEISHQTYNLFPSSDYASHGFSLAVAELGCKDN